MTACGAPAAGDPPGGSANVLVTVAPSDRGRTCSTLGTGAVPAIDPAATLRLTLTAIRLVRVRPESYASVPPPADAAQGPSGLWAGRARTCEGAGDIVGLRRLGDGRQARRVPCQSP
ncbi:hypothetical protein GCM10010187_62250 [Actinomadura coerulea]|nr:hypothetical protein GCM10010187_62250 [Actinomadura coerulea]